MARLAFARAAADGNSLGAAESLPAGGGGGRAGRLVRPARPAERSPRRRLADAGVEVQGDRAHLSAGNDHGGTGGPGQAPGGGGSFGHDDVAARVQSYVEAPMGIGGQPANEIAVVAHHPHHSADRPAVASVGHPGVRTGRSDLGDASDAGATRSRRSSGSARGEGEDHRRAQTAGRQQPVPPAPTAGWRAAHARATGSSAGAAPGSGDLDPCHLWDQPTPVRGIRGKGTAGPSASRCCRPSGRYVSFRAARRRRRSLCPGSPSMMPLCIDIAHGTIRSLYLSAHRIRRQGRGYLSLSRSNTAYTDDIASGSFRSP